MAPGSLLETVLARLRDEGGVAREIGARLEELSRRVTAAERARESAASPNPSAGEGPAQNAAAAPPEEWMFETRVAEYVGLDAYRRNIEQPPWFVRSFEFVRNVLLLCPITLTWLGLHVAAQFYGFCHEVVNSANPGALGRVPFLLLWQKGFVVPEQDQPFMVCDRQPGLENYDQMGLAAGFVLQQTKTFADVLGADFWLLIVILALTAFVQIWLLRYGPGLETRRTMLFADAVRAAVVLEARLRVLRPMRDLSQVTRDAANTLGTATTALTQTVASAEHAASAIASNAASVEGAAHAIAGRAKSAVRSAERLDDDARKMGETTAALEGDIERASSALTDATVAVDVTVRLARESAQASAGAASRSQSSARASAASAADSSRSAHEGEGHAADAKTSADNTRESEAIAAERAEKLAKAEELLAEVGSSVRWVSRFGQRRHVALLHEVRRAAELVAERVHGDAEKITQQLSGTARPSVIDGGLASSRTRLLDASAIITALGVLLGLLVRTPR